MPKFSIIIPTLQKNIKVLNMLIEELVEDDTVGEIILIDNSLKGFEKKSEKIQVVMPKKNLYVNPSWNLGVKLAKYEYVAILNDDIIIPKNLCKQVMQKLEENSIKGLIGMKSDSLFSSIENEFDSYPVDSQISFEEQEDDLYISYWGVVIFGLKSSFYKIPENIKVYCGDNYLIHKNTQKHQKCYQISNCAVKHLGSLSSNAESLNEIKIKDVYNYSKIDKRFKKHCWYKKRINLLEKIFSITNDEIHKVITILGMKVKLKSKKLMQKQGLKCNSFLENIFSIKNEDYHKVITIFGVKLKFKSKILTYKKICQNKDIKQKEQDCQNFNYRKEIDSLSIKLDNFNLRYKKDIYKQKSILYIDFEIFQPDTNAGDRASFSYLKALCKKNYNVYFLPDNANVLDKNRYINNIKETGAEIILSPNQTSNFEYIISWLKENGVFFDYVFINRPDIYNKYSKALELYIKNAKYIYQGHDIHFLRMTRMLEIEPEKINKNDIEYLKKLELLTWQKMDMVLYFSDIEIEIVKSYIPDANALSVPLFLYSDIKKTEYKPQERTDLLFVGGFNHTPNADAMRWFISEIFPIILQNNPNIKLNIAGSNCPQDIVAQANDNIIIHGYLSDEDLQHLYNRTKIVIAPLRYGAGVKGKIIEAMKNQIPVVTTSIGAEGINTDLLTVANKEEDFANSILYLYNNVEKLKYIADNSYSFIQENFSEKFVNKLMEHVDNTYNMNTKKFVVK